MAVWDEGVMMREPHAKPIPILWDVRRRDGTPFAVENCRKCGREVRIMGLREFHEAFIPKMMCRQCRERGRQCRERGGKPSDPRLLVILAAAIGAL